MIRNQAGQLVPVYLESSSGTPVTGVTPTGAELRVTKSGDTLVNGAGTWLEVGQGYYLYTPTADETDTEGYFALLVEVTGAMPYPFMRFIGDGITTTSEARARRVPIYLSLDGVGVEGLTIDDGNTEWAVTTWETANGSGGESGGGLYYYEFDLGELSPFPMAIRVDDAGADTYVYWFGVAVGTVEDEPRVLIEAPYVPEDLEYLDHVQAAFDRLCEQFKGKL